ncbi:Csnk1e [Symbiodinium necroappetens]|uniref:Csnk1e protein n=1 Tax=Symbiodinium necroappetens TaxID=1628268 RepID=A0A812XT40_9DINO|nr:Csnk1e [Symbiodinium necroappetens]
MEMKIKMTFTELCQGLPEEFATFLSYARHLAFDEDPDYRYMRWLFKSLYHREGFRNDGCFDWNVVRARPPSEVAERREARLRKMSVVASQPSDRAADDVVLSFRSRGGRAWQCTDEHRCATARYFEIQDESSQIISAQVDAKPGDMVMDYCAGSGGKALCIAPPMLNRGQVARSLCRNVPRPSVRVVAAPVWVHIAAGKMHHFFRESQQIWILPDLGMDHR